MASQIYVDKKADVTQRASAQSFLAFVTLGVGMFVGAYVSGYIVDMYPGITAGAHEWPSIWLWPAAMAAATLAFFWIGFRDRTADEAAA